ncbi:MAG TPA: helix-turn-helix transcriptional regulator [Geobacteraceae bacterium]
MKPVFDNVSSKKERLQPHLPHASSLIENDATSRSVLGKNILYWRTHRKLTQQELADAVGITRVAVTNLERGLNGTPIHTLMKFCGVLKVTPNDLLLENFSFRRGKGRAKLTS